MPRRLPRARLLALAVWLTAVAIALLVAAREGGGVASVMARVLRYVGGSPTGILLLIGIYLLRPLLLLPVTVLTAFCGYLFGPWLGLLVAHAGGLLSATVAYLAARLWRGRPPAVPAPWLAAMHSRTFETVLVSRLTFVPGDLVNGLAGALALPLRAFMAATLLGGLPGTMVGAFAGAGMQGGFTAGGVHLRPEFVATSLVLAAASLGLARLLRRRVGAGFPVSGGGAAVGAAPDEVGDRPPRGRAGSRG